MFTSVVVRPATGDAAATDWSLLEVQGNLVPDADAVALNPTDDLLVGDLVFEKPQGKKLPCFLVMGTLSVEGEVAKLPKATAVLRRIAAGKKTWRTAGLQDEQKLLSKLSATPLTLFEEFPETDSDRELEEAHEYGLGGLHPAETQSEAALELMRVLTDRAYFKAKPVRSIPKAS